MAEIIEQAMDVSLDNSIRRDVRRKRARLLARKSKNGDNTRQRSRPDQERDSAPTMSPLGAGGMVIERSRRLGSRGLKVAVNIRSDERAMLKVSFSNTSQMVVY